MANWRFDADANTGQGVAIFMASIGAIRASRFALRRRLTLALIITRSRHAHRHSEGI